MLHYRHFVSISALCGVIGDSGGLVYTPVDFGVMFAMYEKFCHLLPTLATNEFWLTDDNARRETRVRRTRPRRADRKPLRPGTWLYDARRNSRDDGTFADVRERQAADRSRDRSTSKQYSPTFPNESSLRLPLRTLRALRGKKNISRRVRQGRKGNAKILGRACRLPDAETTRSRRRFSLSRITDVFRYALLRVFLCELSELCVRKPPFNAKPAKDAKMPQKILGRRTDTSETDIDL